MKFGVGFHPRIKIGSAPAVLQDYAREVESLGYDFLITADHVIGSNPERDDDLPASVTYQDLYLDPFVLFAYLAGVTTRLEFATGILILPQRQTVLVAKQAAHVDFLSGGRLRLGIGVGWNQLEYQALNQDFHNRGRRYDEQIQLLRQLWTQPVVEFKGAYHTVPDAGINPLPAQRPIPLWFGGWTDVALRRASRLGDGWIAGGAEPEETRETVAKIRYFLLDAGRDPGRFGIDGWLNIGKYDRAEWMDVAHAWQALGATHITVFTVADGYQALDRHRELLRMFRETVISHW